MIGEVTLNNNSCQNNDSNDCIEGDNVLNKSNGNQKQLSENLKAYRISNIGKIIIATLNINSLRNKFEELKMVMSGNIDILIITETK